MVGCEPWYETAIQYFCSKDARVRKLFLELKGLNFFCWRFGKERKEGLMPFGIFGASYGNAKN